MTDRLTQLQVCLDQLVAQFNATINYVNTNSEPALLDPEASPSYFNIAAAAPLPGQIAPAGQAGNPAESLPEASAGDSTKQSPFVANTGDAASVAGIPSAQAAVNFENTINELATDIILKSRQLSMLIDSLPGIGVSPTKQLALIEELAAELEQVEKQRVEKIKQKDELLEWCEGLIMDVANGISQTRC